MTGPAKKLDENFVAQNVKQIIEKLGVSATAEVSRQDGVFFIDIASDDSSLLIGKYGTNLEALQFILVVRLKTLTGQDVEIFIDVDGWRKDREEKLKKMAQNIAEKVAVTGRAEPIYNLRAAERRVIHSTLTNHPQVTTISEGEGRNRYIIIKPR